MLDDPAAGLGLKPFMNFFDFFQTFFSGEGGIYDDDDDAWFLILNRVACTSLLSSFWSSAFFILSF